MSVSVGTSLSKFPAFSTLFFLLTIVLFVGGVNVDGAQTEPPTVLAVCLLSIRHELQVVSCFVFVSGWRGVSEFPWNLRYTKPNAVPLKPGGDVYGRYEAHFRFVCVTIDGGGE